MRRKSSEKLSTEEKQNRRAYLLIVILSLWSALPSFFFSFVHTDEGGWATLSQFVFSGDLYMHFTDHKPPALFLMHWLFSLGEHSLKFLHVASALWMAIGGIALFHIVSRTLSRSAGFYAAILFALLSGLIERGAFMAERTYLPFLLLMTLAMFRALDAKAESKRILWALLCGACLGIAIGIKQPAFLFALVPFYLVLRSKDFFLLFVSTTIGAFAATLIVWLSLHVPFEIIWKEGYAANFTYIRTKRYESGIQIVENMKRIGLVLGFLYLPLTLGALRAFFLTRKKSSRHPLKTALFLLIIATVVKISLGGRYYETYFIAALPCLAILSVLYLDETFMKRLVLLAAVVSVSFNAFCASQYLSDRNKNWDSKVQKLADDIVADTQPSDRIWIHHNLHSVYYATKRLPAVKYIYFQHTIGYADPCTAREDQLVENMKDANYLTNFELLKAYQPKVIFWTQRDINTCADKLLMGNFPELQKWIEASYQKKWENDLGIYFFKEELK